MDETLALVEPAPAFEAAYRSLLGEDPHASGRERFLSEAHGDFTAYLRLLDDDARGVNPRPGPVPQNVYWLVHDGATIVGASRLRHALTPALEDAGGHIGYDIRPTERRKGYGTRLLALTLERARTLGLRRVLLTCDADNVGSARIIQQNGGVLTSESVSPALGRLVSRYWIEL
jgi:predicted acetyltransferase